MVLLVCNLLAAHYTILFNGAMVRQVAITKVLTIYVHGTSTEKEKWMGVVGYCG